MEGESPRRARRRQKLEKLLQEIGGATQAEKDTGTMRTHFIAMVKGRRGLGDDLAEKLERCYGKPPGWFDQAESAPTWPFSLELHNEVMRMPREDRRPMENSMWAFLRKDVPERLTYSETVSADVPQPSTVNKIGASEDKGAKKAA